MNINKLVIDAKNGCDKSEKEVFSHLFVRFTLFAKRYVQSSEAEDLAQDACMTIIEKYKQLDDKTNFVSWAYKILRNKIGNHLQKKGNLSKNIAKIDNYDYIVDSTITDPELKLKIERCLKKLFNYDNRYYEILRLTQEGYKTDEICQKFNIKPGYLYVILKRCRSKLIECLELKERG